MLNLKGQTILNTRPVDQASQLSELIVRHGGRSLEYPIVEITKPKSWKAVDEALTSLIESVQAGENNWLVFTSANAIRGCVSRAQEILQERENQLRKCFVAVVGEQTKRVAEEAGFSVSFLPQEATAKELAKGLKLHLEQSGFKGRIVFFRGRNISGTEIGDELGGGRFAFSEAIVYDSRVADAAFAGAGKLAGELIAGRVNVLTFSSSQGVKGFFEALESQAQVPRRLWREVVRNIPAVVIGGRTGEEARRMRIERVIISPQASDEGLIQAMAGVSYQG